MPLQLFIPLQACDEYPPDFDLLEPAFWSAQPATVKATAIAPAAIATPIFFDLFIINILCVELKYVLPQKTTQVIYSVIKQKFQVNNLFLPI